MWQYKLSGEAIAYFTFVEIPTKRGTFRWGDGSGVTLILPLFHTAPDPNLD